MEKKEIRDRYLEEALEMFKSHSSKQEVMTQLKSKGASVYDFRLGWSFDHRFSFAVGDNSN